MKSLFFNHWCRLQIPENSQNMRIKNWILIPLLIAFGIVDCSSIPNNNKITEGEAISKDTLVTGQELFRLNCGGCHGLNREGKPPTFPSLVNIQKKMSKEQIRTQIKNGKGLMPPHPNFSDDEINAIISYLYNEPEQKVKIASADFSPIELGKDIVMSNCVSCHRLSINDPIPAGAKTMCSMMAPAPFAGVAKRFTKDEFYNILQTGPCYMPSFDFLTTSDKDAIWAYLKTLEGKGEPEGKTMGQMCPMMKGMGNMKGMNMNTDKGGTPDTSKNDTVSYYTCPMHPEIKSDKPGKCPKCGMDLIKKSGKQNTNMQDNKMKMMNCPMMNMGGMNDSGKQNMNMQMGMNQNQSQRTGMGRWGGMGLLMGGMMVLMMGAMLIFVTHR